MSGASGNISATIDSGEMNKALSELNTASASLGWAVYLRSLKTPIRICSPMMRRHKDSQRIFPKTIPQARAATGKRSTAPTAALSKAM